MTSRDFCFWLQGYFEVEEARAGEKQPISSTQVVEGKHLRPKPALPKEES